ncbi:MAG TPA: hypothetical protein VLF69_04390 [Candidatus Saccharimonadales bacterium]|nr:hypothetical protein [Candidatus Saccharimonadales bacterium]
MHMKQKQLGLALAITAAVLWNGWILAIFIYPHTTWLHMEISELSIPVQPWSWLFRILDGLSALCMIGLALVQLRIKKLPARWMIAGSLLLLALGLLTLFDITHSLDCVQYNHPACIAAVANHSTSMHDLAHKSESLVTSYISIFFALWVLCLNIRLRRGVTMITWSGILALGIVGSLAILNAAHSLLLFAVTDRLWNLVLSADLLMLANSLIVLYELRPGSLKFVLALVRAKR